MTDELKQIKAKSIDLAELFSYLNELGKTNNQTYVTEVGMSFLEGVVATGNGKVLVYPKDLVRDYEAASVELSDRYSNLLIENQELKIQIKRLKSRLPFWSK